MPIGAIDMSIRGWSQVSVTGWAHNHSCIWIVVELKRENLSCCGKCCVAKTIIDSNIIESRKARMKSDGDFGSWVQKRVLGVQEIKIF